ncbi:hypothetical protein [Pelagerythrobacter marinus]|nr:hypothetical protein [Pelagerythrobacter marinus]WPZ05679.1 hypothetical protein T8T98_09575 [Pelagerythrobacter marinus]
MDKRDGNPSEGAGWFRGEFALIGLLVISLGALALIGLLAMGG